MIGPLPSLSTLRAFLAILDHGSFTGAAAALNLTQTAISHQIAQLEDWLGVRLLTRDRSGVEPTPAGEALLPDLRAALERLEHALQSARRTRTRPRLRVATSPEFGAHWLGPRLDRFCRAHPDIDVSMSLGYRQPSLPDPDIDIAVWLSAAAVDSEQLTHDEEFAVAAPDVAAALPERNAILAAPLLHYQGALHTLLDWRRWAERTLSVPANVKFDFDRGPVFSTFGAMLDACRRGKGLALVRSSLVSDDLAAGRLVRCFEEVAASDLQYRLTIPATFRKRPEIGAFRGWIRAEAAS